MSAREQDNACHQDQNPSKPTRECSRVQAVVGRTAI
jgi:hypothetical protein